MITCFLGFYHGTANYGFNRLRVRCNGRETFHNPSPWRYKRQRRTDGKRVTCHTHSTLLQYWTVMAVRNSKTQVWSCMDTGTSCCVTVYMMPGNCWDRFIVNRNCAESKICWKSISEWTWLCWAFLLFFVEQRIVQKLLLFVLAGRAEVDII